MHFIAGLFKPIISQLNKAETRNIEDPAAYETVPNYDFTLLCLVKTRQY